MATEIHKLDTARVEKSIDANTKEIGRIADTLKMLNRTIELLTRQLEKTTQVMSTSNELAKHSTPTATTR